MTDIDTGRMVDDLRATDDAVRAKGWVAPGLGVPGAPLGMLGSSMNPLSGLAAAGLGWFMPLVSFLGEGLTQVQGGNDASVTSGAQDFDAAGQDIAGVADSYRRSASTQTSEWSGAAATQYREAATQHADGVAGLGEASNTVGSAIIGAGQVVAQAIAEITELIAEAVAQIVPIMTQAVARAGETFGQSVVEAIPPCVAIAVEYALRIAAKLAALLASGQNLLKLVQGALGVVDLIKAGLTTISQQSIGTGAEPETGGAEQPRGEAFADTMAAAVDKVDPLGPADSGSSGSSAAASSGGGSGGRLGGVSVPGGSVQSGEPHTPAGSGRAVDFDTRSAGVVPPVLPSPGAVPDASRFTGPVGGGGVATSGLLGGGLAIGGHLGGQPGGHTPAPGSRVGSVRDGDAVRQENRQQPGGAPRGGAGAQSGYPMGAVGGARPTDEQDREHKRKYRLGTPNDELPTVSPPVLGLPD